MAKTAALALLFAAIPASAMAQTHTSSVAMPEDGGDLPRADMPMGSSGYDYGRRPDSPPGTPDEIKPALQPDTPAIGITAGKAVRLEWGGYIRFIGELVQNDALLAIGRNDGFRIANARLGFKASWGDKLYGYLSLDAAVAQVSDADDANAELAVGLRDAYLAYAFHPAAHLQVGRFKPPYDISELESTESREFIDEPIESRGVLRTQGNEAIGLHPGRQIGVMLHSPRAFDSKDGLDLGYALAVTNGNTGDRVFNDNDHFAAFGRFSLLYSDVLVVSAAGFIDNRTRGTQPDLFEDRIIGAEGSLVIAISGLRVEGQFLLQHDEPVTAGTPDSLGFGFHAQWTYNWNGFEPGYRFAWFEPNTEVDGDGVNEHTISLSYFVDPYPIRLSLNGTFAFEEQERDNHRIALLVQYTF